MLPHLQGPNADVWRRERIGWARYFGEFGEIGKSHVLPSSLLLKPPLPNGEKGVLYVSFEYNWMRLLVHHDMRRFLANYFLVGASSWSPTDFASLTAFAGLSPDPLFVGISNMSDVVAYQLLAPVVEPVPIMACDWINPAYYRPRPRKDRDIDILMVANFLPFKRHWLLFEALKTMRRDLTIVLVGFEAPGRSAKVIAEEARAFRVKQDIHILAGRSIDEITRLQCNSKISVLFSRREGSCVAPAECLFADTPIALMKDAHVGVKAHVNPATGVLLDRERLGYSLDAFLEQSDSFRAREWALQNITCRHSSTKLNDQLRSFAVAHGQPWTRDITALCWRHKPTYVDEADRELMQSALEGLRREYGIELRSA
jgi:hypothetical protein